MIKYGSLLRKIHIHPLLWVVMAISAATAQFKTLAILLAIVLVHELGHAACALYFSWRVKSIVLLPFGGAAEMEEHGNRSIKEELAVVLAGPLQHFLMQGGAWLLLSGGLLSAGDFSLFTYYNLSILLFNLLPIWPLDGGKLLFIAFSLFKPFPAAHKWMLAFSICALVLYLAAVLIFFPFQLNLWMITIFLCFSLYTEFKQRRFVHLRFLMDRYYGSQKSIQKLVPLEVESEENILSVMSRFKRGCKHPIIVYRQGTKWSELDENELLHAFFSEKRTNSKVEELVYAY
ncbi:M50 family metallopeptidase [Bacillus sp. SJS]|uniref:M50 family metallopeptidase n=1 Tax=Bacillus sp. SJS TaxID=1423321 RepID=UPI0004DD0B4E|nr:M50 family metallopeptidase [Bacillus sp. SJS]KZZ86092.1 stage IV sporulation protein FB [Bacillus sp. SJS]